MNEELEQLREYGLQENHYVLAAIFNPNSPLHSDLKSLEETSERACVQAQSAFGSTDEIHLDARLNAALFYWHRVNKFELANNHLQFVTAAVANHPQVASELQAKLLTTLALNERQRILADGVNSIIKVLSGTLDLPFGQRIENGDFRSAITVFRLITETARRAGDVILSYLIWELGPCFSYELWTCGHQNEAVQILRNEVLANAEQVWGKETPQAERVASEVRWLEAMSLDGPQISFDLVDRARREMQDVFPAAPVPPPTAITSSSRVETSPRILELFELVRRSVHEFMSAAPDQITQPITNCEANIRALLNEMQDAGEYAEIMNQTESFLRAVTDQIRSGSEEDRFNDSLSADERDSLASLKEGDVRRLPIQGMNPAQEWLSREHLGWVLYGCGEKVRSSAIAVLILIPSLDVLASLYGMSVDGKKKKKSLELRKLILRLAHANCSDKEIVSRMRVKLAQSLVDNDRGDWDDLMRRLLVHTDGLDFSNQSAPTYHAALGSALRATGFWMRRVQSETSSWVSKDSYPFMDFAFAGESAKSAFAFFSKTPRTIEWAQLMHSQSDAMLTKNIGFEATKDQDPETEKDEDNADGRFVHDSIHHLAAADLVLDPIHFTERWVDIQILRARALNSAAQMKIDLPDDPLNVLQRAKTFISHLEPSILHLRVNLALASLGAMQAATVITDLDVQVVRAVSSCGRYGVRAFSELCEYGEALFKYERFADAASVLNHALDLGERLFLMGRSLDSQRTIAHHLARAAGQLAYCCHRAGDYTKAVMTLERGKARLLLASLKSEQVDWATVPEATRVQPKSLFLERRRLIAQLDSSMAFIEDIDRLAELQTGLAEMLPGEMDTLNPRGLSIEFLSDIDPDSVIALPLITEHGSAVYLVRPSVGKVCDEDVIHLPDFRYATLNTWLVGDDAPGWLDLYKHRNRSRRDQHKFQLKLEEISRLAFAGLIGPLCERVRAHGLSDIIFVPASGLQILPLLCSGPDGPEASPVRQKTLLDDFVFRTVPSATVFQILRRRYRISFEKQGLVVGVSQYDDPRWGPLHTAKIEATMVADEVGVTPLLDETATALRVSREISGSKYVHIACHGSNWATDPKFFVGYGPKAVLILKNDGLSTREILSSWNLQGTQLVCLSACDTGLVDLYRPWDEFEGASNIMLSLGAWKVIASLWSVDDKSTTLLMAMLYRNIVRNKMSPERALRQAQNWLRSATLTELHTTFPTLFSDEEKQDSELGKSQPFAHPYFWASFFAIG